MKGQIKWKSGLKFEGISGTGHSVDIDAPEMYGGTNTAPSPMELVLLGTAGCSAHDLVSILTKKRKDIKNVEVDVSAERASDYPKVFTVFSMHFKVTGKGISEKDVEKAIDISKGKYCSASAMIGKTAEIRTSFEIINE